MGRTTEQQQYENPAELHLSSALKKDDLSERNYHIRSALQHLVTAGTAGSEGATPDR